ncbi:unnamed protein product [Rhodiola kirilowii]
MQIITNPPPKYRRRSSYGTSRRSILKKSFNQEQVNFTSPIPHDPLVAIIGGGISGLLCALSLEKRGIRSTVFDTGVHGLGGSLGTRVIEPQQLLFDHAAQFFTVSDPRFAQLVNDWLDKDFVREWRGQLGRLRLEGNLLYFHLPLQDMLVSMECVAWPTLYFIRLRFFIIFFY